MSDLEYQGIWWLPSNPEHKVAGILRFYEKENPRLDLIGSLTQDFYEIILGIANNKLITLYECTMVKFHINFPGIPEKSP